MFNIQPFPPVTVIPQDKTMNGIFHTLCKTFDPINKYKQVYIDTNTSEEFITSKYSLLEQTEDYKFGTIDDGQEGFITIEFANNYIFLTNFSIKVSNGKFSPKNWKVEGFNGEEWVIVKQLKDIYLCGNQIQNCSNKYDTFSVDENGQFTKVKFTSNGLRTDGTHYGHIQINSIELFGILKPRYYCTYKSNIRYNLLSSLVYLFLHYI